ncbi:MAG: LPS-assembly protein LptD [Maricaulaceae bacterium]|nr:LPS-assembly protein LptD [Maricaulaceae bacterium]
MRLIARAASCVALMLAPAAAYAQTAAPAGDGRVFIEADTLVEVRETGVYIARGQVRARHENRTLYADELEYRPETGRVVARGNVAMFQDGALPQYADEVELDDRFGEGVAIGFSSLLENDGKAAAAFAIRHGDGSIRLIDAYYTACDLCAEGRRSPTWRLRAREVEQDIENQMIRYRDARLEILGVPVLYAPVFAHADPSAGRRSGFLPPDLDISNRLGVAYGQPYLWAISPHQDLRVTARVMSEVNPQLLTHYRKRFFSGRLDVQASGTHEQTFNRDNELVGDPAWRWHVFARGGFDINAEWRWGFTVQRASHDLYLRHYGISETDSERSDMLTENNRRLVSHAYIQGRGRNYYADLTAGAFQTLRPAENQDRLPVIAPMAEFRRVFAGDPAFGRLNTVASAAVLRRTLGADYFRASASADWRTQWITPGGVVTEPFMLGRADYYHQNDAGTGLTDGTYDRAVGLAGVTVRMPFFRPGETADWIVEPVVQLVAASHDPLAGRIVNEDSLAVELDETSLFRPDRSSGYDVWDSGARITYGARATAMWGGSGEVEGFLGQSRRLDGDAAFSPASGMFERDSDIIAAFRVNLEGFSAGAQARLDPDSGSLNRLDARATLRWDRLRTSIRYTGLFDSASARAPSEELLLAANLRLTDTWSATWRVRRDLDRRANTTETAGFIYRDECTQLEILYERENIVSATLPSSESVRIRLTLFTIGGFGED